MPLVKVFLLKVGSSHSVVDFRSDWALWCCRFAFAQTKPSCCPTLALRFRTEIIRFAPGSRAYTM